MLRCALIITVLAMNLVNCSGRACEEKTANKSPPDKRSHFDILRTAFRFSMGAYMFFDAKGIPYQYHVPRIDLVLEDLYNGRLKVPRSIYLQDKRRRIPAPTENDLINLNRLVGKRKVHNFSRFSLSLSATTRELTDPERTNAHLWLRDPVPLNRLMMLLESPIFLGNFFYALTSLTEVDGATVLSRFYYAPVLTARYGRTQNGSFELAVTSMELNVFSICIEPSDAPEDASIPLMHRPQRIIDAGLRKSAHNMVYDVRDKLRENATGRFNIAENHFRNEKWKFLFADLTQMVFRQVPRHNSPYAIIRTPLGNYFNDCLVNGDLWRSAFHGYDFHNDAYTFAYGRGDRRGFSYSKRGAKLLIFLNPRSHFRDENKVWEMCVDLWRNEMFARYKSGASSRLVYPNAYLDESASTDPYYEMLPRFEAVGKPQDIRAEPREETSQLGNLSQPKMSQQQDSSRKPKKRTVKDMRSDFELPDVPNVPWTMKNLEESAILKSLHRECVTASVMPGLSGTAHSGKLTAEPALCALKAKSSDTLPESGGKYGNTPNIPGKCGPLNDGSDFPGYWTYRLPSPASFRGIGAYPDGLFSQSTGTGQAMDWLSGAEPCDTAAGSSRASHDAGDTVTQTRDSMLFTGPVYATLPTGPACAELPTELTHANPLTDNFSLDSYFSEVAPDLFTAIQEIDDATWTGIVGGM